MGAGVRENDCQSYCFLRPTVCQQTLSTFCVLLHLILNIPVRLVGTNAHPILQIRKSSAQVVRKLAQLQAKSEELGL